MRKNLVAALLAGAVAAAGMVGLTACDDSGKGGLQKGDEVTAEKWAAAFAKTVAAENYTAESTAEGKEVITGTKDGKEVDAVATFNSTGKLCYDFTGKKVYSETKYTEKFTGAEAFGGEDGEETSESKSYDVAESKTVWSARYRKYNNEYNWTAEKYESLTEEDANRRIADSGAAVILAAQYTTSETAENSEAKPLAQLYSSFKYDNGYYKAELWTEYEGKQTVTVTVKGEYVTGLQKETNNVETEDGLTETSTSKSVVTFSKFGETTVTAPAEATKAIEDKKAEEENNGDDSDPNSLSGKTYVFDRLEVTFGPGVDQETKDMTEQQIKQMEAAFADTRIEFVANNGFTMYTGGNSINGTYSNDGSNVVLTPTGVDGEPQSMGLSGDMLTSDVSSTEGINITMIFMLHTA